MLDEEFDEYDIVVMVDMDMFVRKGMNENIFKDASGVGMFTEFQSKLFKSMIRKFPTLTNPNFPYWGGAIYRLERDVRQKLRKYIKDEEMILFSKSSFVDEGIMHRLATLSKFNNNPYLPGGFKWCHCSYREGIESASFIHIRTKVTPVGPKKTKIKNYKCLVKRGLI